MISSYWDLYVAYIAKCVRDNRTNDIDPHHYEMEWNHFLPRCVFGDWPIGHWLTKRQHAIASALQTLAFQKRCMFGWHKHYLPDFLLDLAWPYYSQRCREVARENAKSTIERNKTEKWGSGVPKSQEHREKISKALIGLVRTKEHCEKISAAKKGFKHTSETRRKQSEFRKGLPKSEEHKIKIGQALQGRTLSEETKRKISESQKRRLALRKNT